MSIPTMKTEPVVRRTRSVCPVCLAPIPAALVQTGAEIWMDLKLHLNLWLAHPMTYSR